MGTRTGAGAIALEADLWRELAEIRGRHATQATKHLERREQLALRRLRQLGVDGRSLTAVERFGEHSLITREEAIALLEELKREPANPVLSQCLDRIESELHAAHSEETPTRPT